MSTDKIDYATILADAEAKKAALETYINSLKLAMSLGALGQSVDVPAGSFAIGSTANPIDLPVGAFLGKSVPAAIKLYLSSVRKKQTTQQIAAALKDGGVETTATNFETVIAGALFRLKQAGEVLRFPDGWGWAELYPEHIRKAVSQEGKSLRKKGKKSAKAKAKPKTEQSRKPSASIVVPIVKPGGVERQIINLLATSKPLHPSEIANTLELNLIGVKLALGRMAAKNLVEKCEDGKYRALNNAQKVG